MAKKTRTIVTIVVTAIAFSTIGGGFQGTAGETGETRELVNVADCWTGDVANEWDRRDFLSLDPERE